MVLSVFAQGWTLWNSMVIIIPLKVKVIKVKTLCVLLRGWRRLRREHLKAAHCSNTSLHLPSPQMQQFVTGEKLWVWWNQDVDEKSVSACCILVWHRIPEQLGLDLVRCRQDNIYKLLRHIPKSTKDLNAYFSSIDFNFKLYCYENMGKAPKKWLALAIPENAIILQHILSFL
jgi:hypothetical protein